MRFWDSSALVPLLIDEERTAEIRSLLRIDQSVTVWWSTRVECVSALARRSLEVGGDPVSIERGQRALGLLATRWTEIEPTTALRELAERLILVHPLRAADALQLAAALTWVEGSAGDRAFVCLDSQLREAAHKQGFTVLPPSS